VGGCNKVQWALDGWTHMSAYMLAQDMPSMACRHLLQVDEYCIGVICAEEQDRVAERDWCQVAGLS